MNSFNVSKLEKNRIIELHLTESKNKRITSVLNEQDENPYKDHLNKGFNIIDKILYVFAPWYGGGKMKQLENKIKAANKANEELVKKYEVARDEDGNVILKDGITRADNYNFLKGHCMKFCEASTIAHTELMSTHINDFGEKEADLIKILIQGLEACEIGKMHKGALGLECGTIKADLELMLKLLGWERAETSKNIKQNITGEYEISHNGKTYQMTQGTGRMSKNWYWKDANGDTWVKVGNHGTDMDGKILKTTQDISTYTN